MKKKYIEPEIEMIKVKLTEDILTASQESPFTEPTIHTEPETFPSEETMPW